MPGSTTWNNRFWYVYVLTSYRDGKQYVGFTRDLRARYKAHNEGKSFATAPRRPLSLIYYEACTERSDAERREQYLKTTGGRRFLAKRMKDYFRNSKLS